MPVTLRSLYYLLTATTCLFLCSFPVFAQSNDTLQVLILNSYDESTAPYFTPRNVFMEELQEKRASPIAFRQFDLGQRTGNEAGHEELKALLLHNKYASEPPDLVLAIGPPATAFWLKYRGLDFSGTPFIAVASDFAMAAMNFQAGDAVVATHFSFLEAIEDVLKLKPDTSDVVMVFGSSAFETALANAARGQLKNFAGRLNFEYTNQMGLTALQNKLAGLQPGSVVYFCIFDSDVDGVALNNYSGLTLVRANSSVPVFGAFDDQLGRGILGGRLIQLDLLGREMANVAQEVLRNRPSKVAWKSIGLSGPVYDWRELQAWQIAPDILPEGNEILFKPASLWETHAGLIMLTALVILILVILISLLLLQNRRRQRAELASSQLGRRLITAHEDERRYIARELHDDLSQRLARLAIDTSYVASNQGSDAANEVMQSLHPELVSISKDVHDMSYRLHPSLIDDLGLVAALQAECERVHRSTDATILERFSEIHEQIPPDTALCIYRIAQEAIRNAVKYACADTIEMGLEQTGYALTLTVRDDGKGFDTAHDSARSSLGLSSMHERAQLAGGSWQIQSQLNKGTTVSATVPLGGTTK